jgi:hypothetical protein
MFLRLLVLFAVTAGAFADETTPSFVEKPLDQLSDRQVSPLGEKAFGIRPGEWHHAETANFIYHYLHDSAAKPVATEAEFYYHAIAAELEKDTTHWERKCHIFIFDDENDWHRFQSVGGLEPWTGGIHSQGELFIPRTPGKFKGNALAHEVTHLVVYRFFGAGVPLWLNEGLAEYTATRWYASFWRARGYMARPKSAAIAPENYLPLAKLTSFVGYPSTDAEVIAFYSESERLVRFLSAVDKHSFSRFLEDMGKGARFESAFDKAFGNKYLNSEALEKEFKPYAAKDYVDVPR